MKIIHFCAGLEGWNGMANTARQFVAEELARGDDSQLTNDVGVVERTENVDRVHIHGTWLPVLWKVAKLAKKKGAELIVRPCGNYDPIRIRRGAVKRLKKWLVGPFEHAMLNRADFVQCTCAAEAEWVKAYHPKARIQMTDLKRFFDLGVDGSRSRTKDGSLHVLYLGRRDPLKGVEFLERAVAEIQVKVRGAIERSEIAEGLREQRKEKNLSVHCSPSPSAFTSLVECRIETGRTHQIRVHMASLGCPVIGDRTYGKPALDKKLDPVPARQMLHAWKLKLWHPVKGVEMSFEAPLPEDMRAYL